MNNIFSAIVAGMVVVVFALQILTINEVGTDRRDVNRDGEVNLVDLSVLAVEISEENKAQ